MKQQLFFGLKLTVSSALLVFIIWKIGLATILNAFASLSHVHIIIAFISIALNIILGAVNIELLLSALGHHVPFTQLLRYYLTAWSAGMFVPGKIGEFSIIVYLKKHGVSVSEGLVISLADKGITFVVLLVLSLAGVYTFISPTAFYLLLSALALLAIATVFFLLTDMGRDLIKTHLLRKTATVFKGFATALRAILSKRSMLTANAAVTLAKWMVTAVAFHLIITSLGEHISMLWVASIFATTIIISLIPISISGLGVKEGAAYVLFSAAGINAELALAVYFVFTLLGYSIAIAAIALAPKAGKL